ncbi:MAG: MYG1 family protein [Candidatus Zambryskibacteria bacterium]|nr:MYG1 family protein [Candidatus Zambryskibacteria bacterium]
MTKIVTHDSRFHTDDVFAVATLILVIGEAEVVRSRDPEVQATADYLVDTGMQYDPARHMFDHHQLEGGGVRENGIPYASFGLVWKEYGEKVAGGKREAGIIEQRLVQAIDANDNGIVISLDKFEGIRQYGLADFFNSFVESRDPEHLYSVFMNVVTIAKDLLVREIAIARKLIVDESKILSYLDKSGDRRVVVMDENLMGWKDLFRHKPEVLYVVHPRPDGKWSLSTIQDDMYVSRKSLPASWAGLKDEELQKVTGVYGSIFCHKALFMAVTSSKEAAIKLAEIALNS